MTAERIARGHKLVMAGPAAAAAYSDRYSDGSVDEHSLTGLMTEYRAIHSLMLELAGADKLYVINTEIDASNRKKTKKFETILAENTQDIPRHPVPPRLHPGYHRWIRDAHTIINGEFFPNEGSWIRQEEERRGVALWKDYMHGSGLGNGGAVLARKQSVLIGTENSWEAEEEMEALKMEGIRFGIMPVDQKHDVADHIDGYSTLVEDKFGDVALLVAKSYYEPNSHSIDSAARQAGSGRIIIDDSRFPPLAFNLVQFDNLTIAVTDGAEPLRKALEDLVGCDGVRTTSIPIELLPKKSSGSMRCLTNITPESLLR